MGAGKLWHLTGAVLASALLSACFGSKPFVAEYRPLMREVHTTMGRYDVRVELNNRLPFAEVSQAQIGVGWAMFSLALTGNAQLALAANEGLAARRAGRELDEAGLKQPYSLMEDLDASMKTVFVPGQGKVGVVSTVVTGEGAAAAHSTADAVLNIAVRQSFSPEFQRYNLRADLVLDPQSPGVKQRNATLYGDDGKLLYRNSITFTAVLDHVPATAKADYANAWRDKDGLLTRRVMRQAVRAIALLAQRDMENLADQKPGAMATPETITLSIDGSPVKAERLGSGAWLINSYSSDLVK